MTTEIEKAFDFAADLAKQLITLSTGIIALILAFFEKSVPAHTTGILVSYLTGPLLCFLISIVFGIGALMALTGQLVKNGTSATPNAKPPRLFSAAQIILFVFAIGWTMFVALKN
jgi:hypothetical protein